MSTTAEISEPASELERLIAELSGPGLQGVFDFGVDCHLAGVTTPAFGGPADQRRWHTVLGDDAASRTLDVRVDKITGVRFKRGPSMFPSFPGQEVLGVQFLGRRGKDVLHCFVHDLYDGERPTVLAATLPNPALYRSRRPAARAAGPALAPGSAFPEARPAHAGPPTHGTQIESVHSASRPLLTQLSSSPHDYSARGHRV